MTLPLRALGSTGIQVSCLGLGTVKFGRNLDVKYPQGFALPEDHEVLRLLEQARELGINLLDTAPAYGSSEQRLGRLLSNRDDWILTTKVGEEFLSGKSFFNFDAEHVQKSIERSLRHLNTDYLDLVLIHSDGKDLAILESSDCLETLEKLKAKGLIRAIGMSTKTVDGGKRAVELTDAVMVTYNPASTEEESVIDYAAQQHKGVLIKKALNSGHLGGQQGDVASDLAFALNKPGVSSVIVGTINPEHLNRNVAAAKAA
ncbi:MAG: aldo/keto reductase [Pseudohongiellaceae bacterium]|jgi:aryl-alcohol dehydrogenase-like predicted oxidoreductase